MGGAVSLEASARPGEEVGLSGCNMVGIVETISMAAATEGVVVSVVSAVSWRGIIVIEAVAVAASPVRGGIAALPGDVLAGVSITTGAAGAGACATVSMDSSIIVVCYGGGGAPCLIFSSSGEKVTQNRRCHHVSVTDK